jgi:hypothetical protein
VGSFDIPGCLARFQIEVAFDPPSSGDLASRGVDEFSPAAITAGRRCGRRDVARPTDLSGSRAGAGFVSGPRQFDDFVGDFAFIGDGIELFQRRI